MTAAMDLGKIEAAVDQALGITGQHLPAGTPLKHKVGLLGMLHLLAGNEAKVKAVDDLFRCLPDPNTR